MNQRFTVWYTLLQICVVNLGVFELLLLVTVFVLISCNALPPVTPIGLAGWFHAVDSHPLMVRADVWDASGRDLLSKLFPCFDLNKAKAIGPGPMAMFIGYCVIILFFFCFLCPSAQWGYYTDLLICLWITLNIYIFNINIMIFFNDYALRGRVCGVFVSCTTYHYPSIKSGVCDHQPFLVPRNVD